MNQEETLVDILTRALEEVAVKSSPGDEPLDIETYRNTLLSRHDGYRQDHTFTDIRFKPRVAEESIAEELYAFVSTLLGNRAQDGFVLSIEPNVDTVRPAMLSVQNLVSKVLEVAIVDGVETAVAITLGATSGEAVAFREFALLSGVDIREEWALRDGVVLQPLPVDETERRHCLPRFVNDDPLNLGAYALNAALLTVDYTATPRFQASWNPASTPTTWMDGFDYQAIADGVTHSFVTDFCSALSLALNHIVTPIFQWSTLPANELVNTSGTRGYRGSPFEERPDWKAVDEAQMELALDLEDRLRQGGEALRNKLHIPLTRWAESKRLKDGFDESDSFIDLGIALEALYLRDLQNDRGELGFRLATRAAWHLGNDAESRRLLFRQAKSVYDLRSLVAHGGTIGDSEEVKFGPEKINKFAALDRGQSLCRDSIIGLVQTGFPDSWDDLVFG